MMVRESLENSYPLEVQNRSLKLKDSICELSTSSSPYCQPE